MTIDHVFQAVGEQLAFLPARGSRLNATRAAPARTSKRQTSLQNAHVFKSLLGPSIAEPKIDGYRLPGVVQADGSVILYSRKGTALGRPQPYTRNLPHIVKRLEALRLPPGTLIDGELFAKTWGLTAKAKKEQLTAADREFLKKEAQYWAFDVVMPGHAQDPLSKRRAALKKLGSKGNVRLTPSVSVKTDADVQKAARKFIQQGFEGGMVKLLSAPYERHRTRNWQKIKPLKDVTGKIVGFRAGQGKHAGKLGALIVRLKGVDFGVGTGLTDAMRAKIWKNKSDYLGRQVDIVIQDDKKEVAKGRNATFIRMRDDR